ncbi:hypothetical protein BKA81DRAFT_411091 [Phyllosticta paracitricarpa]
MLQKFMKTKKKRDGSQDEKDPELYAKEKTQKNLSTNPNTLASVHLALEEVVFIVGKVGRPVELFGLGHKWALGLLLIFALAHSASAIEKSLKDAQSEHGNDDNDDSTSESTLEEDDHTSATDTSSEAPTDTDSELHTDEEEEPGEFHDVGLGFIRPEIPQSHGRRGATKELQGQNA